jgi:hypothetical protein
LAVLAEAGLGPCAPTLNANRAFRMGHPGRVQTAAGMMASNFLGRKSLGIAREKRVLRLRMTGLWTGGANGLAGAYGVEEHWSTAEE